MCASTSAQPDIILTDRCAQRIMELQSQAPHRILRLSVEPGGCSGFQYAFEIESSADVESDDIIIEQRGTGLVVVDESSLALLRGSIVDFEDSMMRSAFVVSSNPQADAGCGCGSSFQTKI